MVTPKSFNQLNNSKTTTHYEERDQNNFKYVSAPYIKGTTERTNRILKRYDIKFGSKPSNTLNKMLNNCKENKCNNEKTDVYKINCQNCDNFDFVKQ